MYRIKELSRIPVNTSHIKGPLRNIDYNIRCQVDDFLPEAMTMWGINTGGRSQGGTCMKLCIILSELIARVVYIKEIHVLIQLMGDKKSSYKVIS